MDNKQLTIIAEKFQNIFSESKLNMLGKEIEFFQRKRIITPFRLVLSLTSSFASKQIETVADLHRDFNALFNAEVTYKAFRDQLAKTQFPNLMGQMLSLTIHETILKVLSFQKGQAFSEFKKILIQDGTSMSVKDALQEVFPGRFKHIKPAAVEIHTTMNLLCDTLVTMILTPDTENEQAHLPKPETLKDCLLFADRGYVNLKYLCEVDRNDGKFVIRGKEGMNPLVLDAYLEDGNRPRQLRNKKLDEIRGKLPKKKAVDLQVSWNIDGKPFSLRMIIIWNPNKKEFQYLITNLSYDLYPTKKLCLAYKLRWQIELLFKECKSYANLHAFDTEDPDIAEGLIWTAILAAVIKRFVAHATQLVAKVETSTRKVAMCAYHVLEPLFKCLKNGCLLEIRNELRKGIRYLAVNACRAHLKRDRERGRSQLGLEPLLEVHDEVQGRVEYEEVA